MYVFMYFANAMLILYSYFANYISVNRMLKCKTDHQFVGFSKRLSELQLPTGLDVIQYMLYLQENVSKLYYKSFLK